MSVAQIAEIAFTSPDRVREVIHNFNADGFDSLAPKYAGGRPPTFMLPQRQRIKKIALARPTDHDLPFSTWSLSKLAEFLVAEGVVDDISHEGLRVLLREEGVSWPPGPGEVVLEKSVLLVEQFSIGETITVETQAGARAQLRVVGFAHDINSVPTMFSDMVVGYTSMGTLPLIKQPKLFNYLALRLDTGLSQAAASRIAIHVRDHELASAGVQALSTNVPKPGSHFLGDIFKAVSLLLLAMGVLALGLSGFLVVTTVSAIMAQQIRQIGIMKAVGGRWYQVQSMYLVMVTIYGVLAVIVGVPLTLWTGRWFIQYAARLMNFRIVDYTPPAYVIALEIAVGLLVPVLAAIIPVRRGARTSVVAAFTATGMSPDFGHGLLDRALGLIRGLPRPVALSLRNTFLRKGRLALTLTTLILASAVVMSVLSVRASTLQTVEDIGAFWVYDTQVYFGAPQPGTELEREAGRVDGVTEVETRLGATASAKRQDGSENQGIIAVCSGGVSTFSAYEACDIEVSVTG